LRSHGEQLGNGGRVVRRRGDAYPGLGCSIPGEDSRPVLSSEVPGVDQHRTTGLRAIPLRNSDDAFVTNSVYLQLWIKNLGNATARNVEVYAQELRRQRADRSWEPVRAFPPMNLKWANLGYIYFPIIVPEMRKHCDIGHIIDPARRQRMPQEVPNFPPLRSTNIADIRSSRSSKPQRPYHWSRRVSS
jgi:hypothetical protein